MLHICEQYAADHDLKFSTDPNPSKCKTKCIGFLKKKRELPPLKLCGNDLPWVTSGKHLGINLNNQLNGLKYDMKMKRAQYITKNNDICQEFAFCHPATKFHLNQVYNSSFTGSPIWDLFCRESEMIEKSWNTSFRIMFDLPFQPTGSSFSQSQTKLTWRIFSWRDSSASCPKFISQQSCFPRYFWILSRMMLGVQLVQI